MIFLGFVFAICRAPDGACAAPPTLPDLTELSIEELANIAVISTSKTPVKQSQSPAAIFVLTSDDIRRSGATSIPEALRLVPGIQVARISSSKWAVSSRGFNNRYANKLLVMMDGRALYLPFFAGVLWESQDYVLEDIERIEVIRGPGASLWGSNAVNGVINIITKKAKDTTGALGVAGAGDYEQGFGRARLGKKISENGYARAYASYFKRDQVEADDSMELNDDWSKFQTGFRSDFTLGNRHELTFQGDYYKGELNELTTLPDLVSPYYITYDADNSIEGYNALGRLTVHQENGSELSFQLYGDNLQKEEGNINIDGDVLDFDFYHKLPRWGRHELIWGLGSRFYSDTIQYDGVGETSVTSKANYQLYSSFIQDSIQMTEAFQVIIGSRFEHNEYTDFEFQPNARFLWNVSKANVLWGAVSRAVRTPSRMDTGMRYVVTVADTGPSSPPIAFLMRGNEGVNSENLTAFELGHRYHAGKLISFDSTVYYYIYDDLTAYRSDGTLDPTYASSNPPYFLSYLDTENLMSAKTWGFEFSATCQPFDYLRLKGAYTFIHMRFEMEGDSAMITSLSSEVDTPEHQASLQTSMDLPWNMECDAILKYVDDLEDGAVDNYTEMDLVLGWKPNPNIELTLCGQNLFHDNHQEFLESYLLTQSGRVPRSFYGKVTLRY